MTKQAIIFDITGVLFKENKLRLVKKIGIKRLIGYIASHRTNPLTLCLNTLQELYEQDLDSDQGIIFKHRTMPACIADWQRGVITNIELIARLNKLLQELARQNHFKSKQEQALIQHILETTLNTEYLVSIAKPITGTIDIIKTIKEQTKLKVFILSNMAHEPFELLKKTYPEILDLFDGVVISADTRAIKPEPAIFEHLLTTYNLNPADCIFVDDQQENIGAAEHIGITGILFDSASRVRKKLVALKLIS